MWALLIYYLSCSIKDIHSSDKQVMELRTNSKELRKHNDGHYFFKLGQKVVTHCLIMEGLLFTIRLVQRMRVFIFAFFTSK